MKNSFKYLIFIFTAAALGSCLDNHYPAPEIKGMILGMEVEGQLGMNINEVTRTVTLSLDETADMQNVRVKRLDLVEGGSSEAISAGTVHDLTQPKKVIVRTLADYEWTISATQNIKYKFEIGGMVDDVQVGQVGESYFELLSHSVFAYVPIDTDMERIEIKSLKLWPDGTTATTYPEIGEGSVVKFRKAEHDGEYLCEVNVRYTYDGSGREVVQKWYIYITETETQLNMVDPFTRRAYLSALGQAGMDNGFQWREITAGSEPGAPEEEPVWRTDNIEMTDESGGGVFSAFLKGLTPDTEYEVRAFSGESFCEPVRFTTFGEGRPLPGGDFDGEWHRGIDERRITQFTKNRNAVNPWPLGGEWEVNRWWDTGNRGVAAVDERNGGNSLQTADGEGVGGRGRAVRLESIEVMSSTLDPTKGKVAGGNIYFGEFGEVNMNGFNATCHLGHTWTDKPTKLKGWYKYFPRPIDNVSEDHRKLHPYKFTREQWIGSPDSLHVCVALWASPDGEPDTPFTVDTNLDSFLDFSRDVDGVIAYGAFITPDVQAEWGEFTVEMDYLKHFEGGILPSNTQLYLLITASKNCNYFIAGSKGSETGKGSLMYVDNLELVYD